jgi:hypothetical protein
VSSSALRAPRRQLGRVGVRVEDAPATVLEPLGTEDGRRDHETGSFLRNHCGGADRATAAATSALKDTLDAMRDEGRRLDDRAVSLSLAYLEAIVQNRSPGG